MGLEWRDEDFKKYSLRSAYQINMVEMSSEVCPHCHRIWNKLFPLNIFMWRPLQNKLVSKDNLVKQRVSAEDKSKCSLSCDDVVSISHLLLKCLGIYQIRDDIFN